MKKKLFNAALPLAATLVAGTFAGCRCQDKETAVVMDIDMAQKGIEISPTLYGLFYEEINHAGEGGLYAELIGNRSFEEDMSRYNRPRRGGGRNVMQATSPENMIPNWNLVIPEGASAAISLEKASGKQLNKAQKNALKWSVSKVGAGEKVLLRNSGFWGINAVKERPYKLTFWARVEQPLQADLEAGLMGNGGEVYAAVPVKVTIGTEWQKYSAEFISTGDEGQAAFYLAATQPGTFYLDMVSLFPPTFKDRPNGCRPDLAQMLADIHPKFMRFPGGCFVEGMSKESAFDWRTTIGAVEERPGHMNLNWGYRCTDGFGYHEMLQLCEDLNAAPLFVVNVGIWHGGFEPYDKIDDYVQSALDAIEYANGDVTTKYGAMRAAAGHPEPFRLKYIEVGNENYQPDARSQSDHYAERYIQFYNAIKAKYPDVQIIGNVESWGTDYPSWRNPHPVDILDEHYYRTPAWFAKNYDKYDNYDRKGAKIYTGEYAVTSDCGQGNLNAALGEAIFMMGMENNSDVVTMCSYAPIFVNWNDRRWMPDMIRFNSAESYGSPSYWVQRLSANHVGTHTVGWELSVPEVKQSPDFTVGVGTWATQAEYKEAKVAVNGDTMLIPFTNDSLWEKGAGEWNANDGVYGQSSRRENCISFYKGLRITSPDYTYMVKACKRGGNEGFLMLFNVRNAGNYYWLNIGGWGNTAHAIEQVTGNGKTTATTTSGNIENDVWYNLRVEVRGDSVRCFLNDLQINAFACGKAAKPVYANAMTDAQTGDLVVKMVNFGAYEYPAFINLKGGEWDTEEVEITTLNSANGTDENTMEEPLKIVPVTTKQPCTDNEVEFTLSPYSVNIIRARIK